MSTSIPRSNAPINETPSQIWFDKVMINGSDISFVAYGTFQLSAFHQCINSMHLDCFTGVYVALFFLCISLLWADRANKHRGICAWIVFTTVVFLLDSVGNAMNMYSNQLAYVTNRNYIDGPAEFEVEQFSLAFNVVGNTAFIVSSWFQDALLVCHFIYRMCTILILL